jgi:hypothetical protein
VVLHLAYALTDNQQDDLMAALAARFIRDIQRSGGAQFPGTKYGFAFTAGISVGLGPAAQ